MSVAKKYDGWSIVTGQDFREKFIVRDPTQAKIANPDYNSCDPNSPKKIYPPKDLTGWTVKMDIRAAADVSSALVKALVTGAGITLGSPTPTDGTVELFIDSLETKAAPFTTYKGKNVYFDLFLIPPNPADNVRIIYGSMMVIGAVTDV